MSFTAESKEEERERKGKHEKNRSNKSVKDSHLNYNTNKESTSIFHHIHVMIGDQGSR